MARKQWTIPIPPLSLTLTHSNCSIANCVCVCMCVWLRVKKWLALLVLFITVNRTDTPAPLPFILASILNDKPPQSHSPLCLYASTRTPLAWCRPSPKPQWGSNSAPLFAHQPPSLPPFSLPPRPAPDDAGWRGRRHASTGTPEERKGGNEGWRVGGIGEKYVGGKRRGRHWKKRKKKKRAGLTAIFQSFSLSSLSFLHFSVHSALHERGFSECVFGEEVGGFEGATPSVTPLKNSRWRKKKVVAEVYFWFELGS